MGTVENGAASFPGTSQQPEIVVGLLASPGPASELTARLLGCQRITEIPQ